MSGITLIETFTTCSVYYTPDTHTRAPCCTLVRPSVPRRFAAGGRMADHYAPPAASLPGSLPRSLGPFALFPHSPCERQRERGTGGRGGRLLMARPPTSSSTPSHAIRGRGRVGFGWHQRHNKKANTFPTSPILPWFHLPPRLSPFSSSHLSPPGNACEARVYGNGWHAHGRTALSGCCSSGLPRENESGLW